MASVSDGAGSCLFSHAGPPAIATPKVLHPVRDLATPKEQPTPPLGHTPRLLLPAWRTSRDSARSSPGSAVTPVLSSQPQMTNVFSTAFQLQLRLLIHAHIQEIQHVCSSLESSYVQHCAQHAIKQPAMQEIPHPPVILSPGTPEATGAAITKTIVSDEKAQICDERDEESPTIEIKVWSTDGKSEGRRRRPAKASSKSGLLTKMKTTSLDTSEKKMSLQSSESISSVVAQLSSKEERPRFVLINRMVYNVIFDVICAVMIGLASVQLGAAVAYSAARPDQSPDDLPVVYVISDSIFFVWFVVELIFRFMADLGFIYHSREFKWNVFDSILVATDACARFWRARNLNISAIRVLRVLRMAKVLRVVRYIRFFRELRMMVHSIMWSGKPLVWSIFLLIAIVYMFAVFLTMQVTSEYYHSDVLGPDMIFLRRRFRSIPAACLTLYMAVAGGISWVELADPLIDIHWSNGFVLTFYTFFAIFAAANIITGVFVDSAIHAAQSDRDELIQEQLNEESSSLWKMVKMFQEADVDKSGELTSAELFEHLRDPHMRAHFAAMGLRVDQVPALFRLLDADNSGSVSIEEFAVGCTRVQGSAKSIDLVTLMQENRRLSELCNDCFEHMEDRLEQIWTTVQERREGPPSKLSNGLSPDAKALSR